MINLFAKFIKVFPVQAYTSSASMAAADRERTAVYCKGSIPQVIRAARQSMEFSANRVRQNRVSRKRRKSALLKSEGLKPALKGAGLFVP